MSRTDQVKLLSIGILPLIIGLAVNYYIMQLSQIGFRLILLGIVLLILWGYLSYKVAVPESDPLRQAFMLCAFGLLMLILVLYQELVRGEYWGNLIGFGTQMFFLPFLAVLNTIISPLMRVGTLPPIYIAVWLSLFFISYVGCRKKCQK